MSGLYERIYAIVRRIPRGKAATYGQVALLAGTPRLARVVGYALHRAPADVPCHRVVDRFGGTKAVFDILAPGTQRAMLQAEGVLFDAEGRVDLARCRWCAEA